MFISAGRGEPIRLTLAGQELDWECLPIDYGAMKKDREGFPCGQAPCFVDDEVDMVQSNAILRHLGRKYDLYGSNLKENAQVDMIIETVESIKGKYLTLVYTDNLEDTAKDAYWKTHLDLDSIEGRNSGAHFAYLDALVKKLSGDGPFALGSTWSIADIVVFDIVDRHINIWGDDFKTEYPDLTAVHAAVAEIPGVKTYLASDRRPEKQ